MTKPRHEFKLRLSLFIKGINKRRKKRFELGKLVFPSSLGKEVFYMNRKEIFDYVGQNAEGTILSFKERGPWGDSRYRGNFSGWIPASLIYRYGAESVSEIFAGSGTTSDLCKDLAIPYIGVDLNPNPVRKDIVSMNILDDNCELPDQFLNADLQILHPPYPTINGIHYSNVMWRGDKELEKQDIQEMNWADGMKAINKAIARGYMAMKPGSYQAYVIGDVRQKINNVSTFRSMLSDINIVGELQQILIKAQHNTVSGRNIYNTNCKRKFFLIEHEFIVVIKKPSGYEIAVIIPRRYECDIRDMEQAATWKDVVMAALRKINKKTTLDTIYNELSDHKKAKNNVHYKEKIRQTLLALRDKGLVVNTERGVWEVA